MISERNSSSLDDFVFSALVAGLALWFGWATFRRPRPAYLGSGGWIAVGLSLLYGSIGITELLGWSESTLPFVAKLILSALIPCSVGVIASQDRSAARRGERGRTRGLLGASKRVIVASVARIAPRKVKPIDPIWQARGDIIRLKTYRWSKPAFVVVGSDSLFVVLPLYFGSTAWELEKGDVVGLVPDDSESSSDPVHMEQLVAPGVMSFESPYLSLTSLATIPTTVIQTWLPTVTPPFRRFVAATPFLLWPGRKALVYGVSLREEDPGQLLGSMQQQGWETVTAVELLSRRRSPLLDTSILTWWGRARTWDWLITLGPFALLALVTFVGAAIASDPRGILIVAIVLAWVLIAIPQSVKERRLRLAIKRTLLPEIAAQLDTGDD